MGPDAVVARSPFHIEQDPVTPRLKAVATALNTLDTTEPKTPAETPVIENVPVLPVLLGRPLSKPYAAIDSSSQRRRVHFDAADVPLHALARDAFLSRRQRIAERTAPFRV